MKSIVLPTITRRVVPIFWLLLLTIPSLLAQDTSKNAKFLIGEWELDYNMSISNADGPGKVHYDTISTDRKAFVTDSFSQRRITFLADGSYILRVKVGYEVSGTWSLLSDDVTLVINLDGKRIEQRIEQINGSYLLLNLGEGQNSTGLFRRWYLNKVNG